MLMHRPLNLHFTEQQIMGLAHQEQQQEQSNNSLFLLDALYCKEHWDDDEEDELLQRGFDESDDDEINDKSIKNGSFFVEQDLFWEDEELRSLFSKEQERAHHGRDPDLGESRGEAVEWILRVNAHFGFSALTAILAVNYLDRFITSRPFQGDKPWMTQLVSVACLSLAAKVEETHVPLLLDMQVEERKCVFEAKTIQRMELVVLSTLNWKMNPVTPMSFIDHIVRRLGLKTCLQWEFMKRCECVLLSVLLDSKFTHFLPSVLATVTMLLVIDQVEPSNNKIEYKNQLMSALKMSKDKIDECYQLILESNLSIKGHTLKRKHYQLEPRSPNGVIDAWFSCDSSNDTWVASAGSSVSSSPEPLFKKKKHELCLGGFNNSVAVDVLD
ncbi:hypothetical protein Sjap_022822 [Stephania japonica]|uniref:B-like cyclin n=1 Tax=Stephania japonica TaxID=461633 RepID=A0AAP0ES73_9MAGN